MMYQPSQTRFAFIGVLLFVGLSAIAEKAPHMLMTDGPKGGWLIFGQGVLDSSVDAEEKAIQIDVNWTAASWGIGGLVTLAKPINGKMVKEIRLVAKTAKGSKTAIFAGVATTEKANLAYPASRAITLSDQWQEIAIPIRKMVPDRPDADSKMFVEEDWEKIQIIKLLFTKPESETVSDDRIMIQNPVLIAVE